MMCSDSWDQLSERERSTVVSDLKIFMSQVLIIVRPRTVCKFHCAMQALESERHAGRVVELDDDAFEEKKRL
jgi:hypothetical protein